MVSWFGSYLREGALRATGPQSQRWQREDSSRHRDGPFLSLIYINAVCNLRITVEILYFPDGDTFC